MRSKKVKKKKQIKKSVEETSKRKRKTEKIGNLKSARERHKKSITNTSNFKTQPQQCYSIIINICIYCLL